MREPKRILILYSDADLAASRRDDMHELAESLTRLGAVVTLEPCDGRYDGALEALAAADSVLFWR